MSARADERFHATFEDAAIGVATRTLDDHWTWFNRRWCEIVGFTREELVDRNLAGLTHPEDFEASLDFEKEVKSGGLDRGSIQKRIIRKDGIVVWVQLTMSITRDTDSRIDQCVAFLDDIIERKKAEQRVAAQFSVAKILGEAPDADDALLKVIKAKQKGKEIHHVEAPEEEAPPDLMEALRLSLERSSRGSRKRAGAKRSNAKRRPSRARSR